MKKKPIERIGRIEKSIHDIYLTGVEMEVMNASGNKNHKDTEIICALGGIKKQIDLVIADLQKLKKVIEAPRCEASTYH